MAFAGWSTPLPLVAAEEKVQVAASFRQALRVEGGAGEHLRTTVEDAAYTLVMHGNRVMLVVI